MDLISKKFKYLSMAQSLLGEKIVPSFTRISSLEDVVDVSTPSIMRSSIRGEAGVTNLLSGKSLSIAGLYCLDDFRSAYQKISMQPALEEVIIQQEIPWEQHLTLIFERDFFFVEIKSRRCGEEKPKFYYWTPVGNTYENNGLFKSINQILLRLKPLTVTSPLWLMELGQKDGEIFLFQVQPIDQMSLGNIFSQNLVQEMLLSRNRFQKSQTLLAMMKTELSAYKFRKNFSRTSTPSPSWIFLNWEYIFHYFRIYCLQKKLHPNQSTFAAFLTVGHEKNWMGEILRLHFKMANQLRLSESYDEMNFIFDHNPAFIFIGKGQYTGKIGKDFIQLVELTPQLVYELDPTKIILTKTFSLLSHGILAAIERNIRVVAGIPEETWARLSNEESICLDFETRTFHIQ